MNVQIMSTPCYLLETVELIYAFVNGVPAEELTGPGSYCIPVREVQRIMDTVCAGLALQNPTLQFFFQKEALADDSGDFTCIARNIAYFVSTFSCKTISSAFDLLRKSWLTILQEHSYPASIGRYTFDCGWQDESESESTNLELGVNQLLISQDYREKLLNVLKNFDYYTHLLEELIAPVERRLELLMVPWVKHSEPLRQNWYAYLTQPDLPSLLQQKWKFVTKEPIDQVYAVLGYFSAKVQMLELETLGNQNVIYIHIGVNCTTDLCDEEEFAPWEIRALRLLGSQARIKLLKAIHAQPMSTRELAQNLGMNLGSVGRDVSSLLTAGLLVVEVDDDRRRYRINTTALDTIIQHLTTLRTPIDSATASGRSATLRPLFCYQSEKCVATEINFVKEISAKAHGDGYMSFSSNFWLDFVTVWGVIRLNLEPTQKADCISRIFIPKIDFPDVLLFLVAYGNIMVDVCRVENTAL